LAAFAGSFPFTQAEGQIPAEVAMPKKSLVQYVTEIRKEILAKNCQGVQLLPGSDVVQTKPLKASGRQLNGNSSGGQKRKQA
jgi:hypothetical protein